MYLERYLLIVRNDYTDFYNYISQNDDWKNLIGTLWDRAWFYYEKTKDIEVLGIQDEDAIYEIVTSEKLLNEICTIRGLTLEE